MSRDPALYHMARLSSFDLGLLRSPGPGLGNLLLPIARAFGARRRHGGTLVYPTFRQLKIGTILRWERDFRTYGDLFRGRAGREWGDWIRAGMCKKVPEDQLDMALARDRAMTVTYTGLGRQFHQIMDEAAPFAEWLDGTARYQGLIQDSYDIAVHIRLGDFFVDRPDGVKGSGYRQSYDWYRDAVALARDILGEANPRVMLFTDEDPNQVAGELGLDAVELDPGQNAVTAIRNLSKARLIVTSRSSFSMWGVFLGGAQAIWQQGYDLGDKMPVRDGLDQFL